MNVEFIEGLPDPFTSISYLGYMCYILLWETYLDIISWAFMG